MKKVILLCIFTILAVLVVAFLPLKEMPKKLSAGVEKEKNEERIMIWTNEGESDTQIKVAIFPSSGGCSETYLFEFDSTGKLIAEHGTRNEERITPDTYILKDDIYAHKTGEKLLSSSEFSKIVNLADAAYKETYDTPNSFVEDSWIIQIFYNGKIIKQDYWNGISPQVKEFSAKVIQASPIGVNLHGWS